MHSASAAKLEEANLARFLLVALSLMLLLSPLEALAQGETVLPVIVEPTNVYGAYRVGFEGLPVTSLLYLEDLDRALLAGPGYMAALDIGSMKVAWTRSLIGEASVIKGDSFPSPQRVVVATSGGEVLVIDPSASVEVVEYFTSGGVSVVDASIGWSGSGLTVLALDSTGSLYFYKVPQRYWSVIGPSVGDEALSGIGDTVVSWFEPVTRLEGWALYSVNASRVLVNPSRYPDEVFSNLSITFYYNKTGLPAPAVPGVEEDPLYLRVKTLVYALVLPGANAAYLVERVESGNTSTFNLERIHASQYVIHGFFEESVIDKSTGNVVSSVCYYSNETVALSPGRDLEVLLLLQPLAGSLEECYSITGVDPSKINRASIDTLLVVDTSEVPADISLGSQTRLVQIPYPVEPSIGVQSIDQPALKLLVEPSSVPEGWPAQASYMLLIGVGKALLIYLLNSSLNVLDFPGTTEYGFLEVVALESTPSSIVVSPDASRIYVGTSNGRLVELSWVLDEQSGIARYIATRSLQVAAAQVSSLALLPGGKFLLTTAVDGSIQLVDLASWRPLWRGIKGFPSIQLNLGSLEIAYADQSKAVYFSGEGFMAVFYHDLRKYVPLEVRLDVTVKSLNGGSYSIEVPGSRAYILDPGGNAVAQAVIGEEAFFAPEGEHRLLVELPGFGSVEYADVRVSFPSTVYTASIVLREVEVYAFTPAESDVESGKYANLLLSGPRPGASVTALPLGQSQVLGYTVYPTASSSVTGENGTVTLILWDGVSYDITASLAHFREGRGSTGFFDPERVELEMQPELYSTTISVVDSEAASLGVTYNVENVVLTITLLDNGRSVNVSLPEGFISLKLPWGLFLLEASSENYEDASATIFVDRQLDIVIEAPPKRYVVTLKVYLNDQATGIANGPLSNAEVGLRLAEPAIGWGTTITLDENGEAVLLLRYGIYVLSLENWVVGNASKPFLVDHDGEYLLAFRPKYSNVSFTVEDSEIKGLTPEEAVLAITYLGGAWTSTVTLSIDEVSAGILLPYGDYRISISAPRYYTSTVYARIDSPVQSVRETMDPVKVRVLLRVEVNDPLTGIASGPVEGAVIRLRIVEPQIPLPEIVLITGERGVVAAVMRLGSYNVSVEHRYMEPVFFVTSITEVTSDIDIRMKPIYANLSLSALDAETGSPVITSIAYIERLYPGTPSFFTLDLGNLSSLTTVVPSGLYRVTLLVPDRYKPLTVEVDVKPGTGRSLTLELEPERTLVQVVARVRGALIAYQGDQIALPETPLRKTRLVLQPVDPVLVAAGAPAITVFTDEKGVASIGSIRSGTYLLRVSSPGYEPSETIVTVAGASSSILFFAKPEANPVVLNVLDEELEPGSQLIELVTLEISRFNGESTGVTISYAPGTELLLPTGSYTLTVSSPGYVSASLDTTILGPATLNVSLEAVRLGVTLTVTVAVGDLEGQVLWGKLVLRYIDLPLRDPLIEAEVSQGEASVSLRPGRYMVWYVEEALNITSRPTTLSVTVDKTSYQVELSVEPVDLEIRVVDSELGLSLEESLALLSYSGPLGTFTMRETVDEGGITVSLPPGAYAIITTAEGYEEAITRLNVTRPGSITISQPPVKVSVTLNLKDVDGSLVTLNNVVARLAHSRLPITLEFSSKNGIIEATGLRLGSYYVEIVPPTDSAYKPVTVALEITREGANQSTIILPFKEYNVTISLIEEDTGDKARGVYKIELSRREPGSQELGFPLSIIVEGESTILLPPGTYEASLALVEGADLYKIPRRTVFTVRGPAEVSISLEPRIFDASLIVVDDRGEPVANALVQVLGPRGFPVAAGYTDSQGVFKYKAKYGLYTVTVTKQGYSEVSMAITLPDSPVTTIALDPTLRTIVKRYIPLIIGALGLLILGGVLYSVRGKIAEKILEEEYF